MRDDPSAGGSTNAGQKPVGGTAKASTEADLLKTIVDSAAQAVIEFQLPEHVAKLAGRAFLMASFVDIAELLDTDRSWQDRLYAFLFQGRDSADTREQMDQLLEDEILNAMVATSITTAAALAVVGTLGGPAGMLGGALGGAAAGALIGFAAGGLEALAGHYLKYGVLHVANEGYVQNAWGVVSKLGPGLAPETGLRPNPRPGPSPMPDPSYRASGGLVLGPGSDVSDSVPAWLSNGEWVVRAGAVDALGQDVLGMLNQWDQLSPDQRAAVGGALSSAGGLRGGGPAGASPSAAGFGAVARFGGGGPVSAFSPFSAMALNPVAWTVLAATVDGALATGATGASAAADAARKQQQADQDAQNAKNAQQRAELATEIKAVDGALAAAKDRLREAQTAFDNYNKSVAAGVQIGTDFTTALGAQSKAQDALTDAVKTQTDAQKALAVAKASGTDAQIASATRALAEADQKVAAAKDQTGGFLSFLQKGAESAAAFATQIDNLRAAGASSDVVQKIAQLGAASGGSAAGELLAGGTSSIAQANYLVQLVTDLSNKTGLGAAKQYYGPALDAAQYSYDSIAAQLASLKAARDAIPMANGGIVTAPTFALVGEAGPEAIIPLNRASALGSGSAINVSMTVHGSVVQENDLVVSVRDGIAQLMRRRGLDPAIIGV